MTEKVKGGGVIGTEAGTEAGRPAGPQAHLAWLLIRLRSLSACFM